MVSFTSITAFISMALLASTTAAAPALVAERDPPQAWPVLSFTLFKTLQPGDENQCWWGAPGNNQGQPPSSEFVATTTGGFLSACHPADFYTLAIYYEAAGWNNCQVNVYSDDACHDNVGAVQYTGDFSQPCTFPGGGTTPVDLLSWQVSCY